MLARSGFDLHFPVEWVILSIFSCTYWPSVCPFGEKSLQGLCPFFKLDFFLCGFFVLFCLVLSCRSSLYILDINPVTDMGLKIFCPIWLIAFSFNWWFSFLCRSCIVLSFFISNNSPYCGYNTIWRISGCLIFGLSWYFLFF